MYKRRMDSNKLRRCVGGIPDLLRVAINPRGERPPKKRSSEKEPTKGQYPRMDLDETGGNPFLIRKDRSKSAGGTKEKVENPRVQVRFWWGGKRFS